MAMLNNQMVYRWYIIWLSLNVLGDSQLAPWVIKCDESSVGDLPHSQEGESRAHGEVYAMHVALGNSERAIPPKWISSGELT